MNEKFNENANVEKFTTVLGIAVHLIVIDPYRKDFAVFQLFCNQKWEKHGEKYSKIQG